MRFSTLVSGSDRLLRVPLGAHATQGKKRKERGKPFLDKGKTNNTLRAGCFGWPPASEAAWPSDLRAPESTKRLNTCGVQAKEAGRRGVSPRRCLGRRAMEAGADHQQHAGRFASQLQRPPPSAAVEAQIRAGTPAVWTSPAMLAPNSEATARSWVR